ncbi:MAG: Ni/Fe-hydrogenase, b-type cytochrome subunit [Candidatus Zixiibacteriota bacterium]|nr:MAG: Ni/Fe-hydrogenase, b-type cytochrome subunit [candidate division Zixibacteria bacterium]
MAETWTMTSPRPIPGTPGSDLVRAYIWELPVRITHWVIFFAVLVLSVTGYYIHRPYISFGADQEFTMATMRFIHVVTGFVFTLAFLVRMYWMFTGNYCARWRAFIPLRRYQWTGMGEMFKYYTFLRWYPAFRIGHNALAAVAYMVIFLVMLIEILTGLVMFERIVHSGFLEALVGWIPLVLNIQYLREIHFFIMFVFFIFIIHHVYSAALVSAEEKNGLVESIFTGYKFVPVWSLTGDPSCIPPAAPRQPPPAPVNVVEKPQAPE